jgi:benzylsuccinate CoA-transferase BbsF subunit
MLAISSGGATGPDRDDRGYAAVFAALSGFSELMGYEDGAPVEFRGQCDMVCGTFGAYALLAALMHRQLTGQGQLIDASNREMLSSFIGEALVDQLVNRRSQRRNGNQHVAWTPNEVYRCAGDDRWISITVTDDAHWRRLAAIVGGEALVDDERFADGYLRWKNREALDAVISGWTLTLSDTEAMARLQAAGIAAAPTLAPPDVLADPHIEARDWWRILELGKDRTPHIMAGRAPWLMSETPCTDYRPGSAPGDDTDSVLSDVLGMSDTELAELREKRIIR